MQKWGVEEDKEVGLGRRNGCRSAAVEEVPGSVLTSWDCNGSGSLHSIWNVGLEPTGGTGAE